MATRKQTRSQEHPQGYDRDHFLYYRADWEARAESKRLRRIQWLIAPLDRIVHAEKHREVSYVPTLGRFVLASVARDYEPVAGDHIASLEALVSTIEDKRHDNRLPSDERAYSELTIDALVRQLPFIRAGIVRSI